MANVKIYYIDRSNLLTSNRPFKSLSPRIIDLEILRYMEYLFSQSEFKRISMPQIKSVQEQDIQLLLSTG